MIKYLTYRLFRIYINAYGPFINSYGALVNYGQKYWSKYPNFNENNIAMRLKIGAIFPFGFLLLTLFCSCNSFNTSENEQFNGANTLTELDNLLLQLYKIDTSNCENLDDIVTINEKMRRLVENIRTNEKFENLINTFDEDTNRIGFVFSDDKQFGVFSWQTKMDCLGNSIKNIALFKSNGGVKVSSLYGEPMVYHNIQATQQDKNRPVYILAGSASTEKDSNSITKKGYKITNGYLAESQVAEEEQEYVNNTSL